MRFLSHKTKFLKKFFILLFLILIFLFQKNLKNFFYSFSAQILNKFWEGGAKISIFFKTIFASSRLEKENQLLRVENQKLLFENILLKELKKENDFLRDALNIGLNKEFEIELASVLSRDVLQDNILINRGTENGISVGLPVITKSRTLIGKIKEVYKNFSKVELVSSKGFTFDIKIESREIYGKAIGNGGVEIIIERLPATEKIEKKEVIITSSAGGIFPPNLLVGQIVDVKKSDIETFQAVKANSFFKMEELDYVFIIKKW